MTDCDVIEMLTTASSVMYEGCSEGNAAHYFLRNYLFRTYEIHAQHNWMLPLHMLFFHIISIYVYIYVYVYGLMPA
jgi:hypothetical protein